MRRLALVVGDTPGHYFPALAVATAYKERRHDVDVVFFGSSDAGAELAERSGWRYCAVSGGQLARVGFVDRSRAAVQTFIGLMEARKALRAFDAQLVVGFGAYSSGAVVLAGKTLGMRTAICEGNIRAGIANRLLAKLVHRIYVANPGVERMPVERARVTGWPIRPEIAKLSGRKRTREDQRRLRMLVCSGSRGGAFFAERMPKLLGDLQARGLTVSAWHQCAESPARPILEAYRNAGIEARVVPFIDEMGEAYKWADFAIARAGAGTLAELAAAALPSLIVPLGDAAEDHQSWNARRFAAEGAALWMREAEWDSAKAAEEIGRILEDQGRWTNVSDKARGLSTPTAAHAVVDECERTLIGQA